MFNTTNADQFVRHEYIAAVHTTSTMVTIVRVMGYEAEELLLSLVIRTVGYPGHRQNNKDN